MPLIKDITAISYSSQDSKYTLSCLLNGSGPWLNSLDDKSGSLTADLKLNKATTISYIDVGNHNSISLSIEVSRSLGNSSASLLPTVVLMTPQQLRSQENNKAVRMFKTNELDKVAVNEKWDRVRVICSQPFKRDVQFGLSFLKLYTTDAEENSDRNTAPLHPHNLSTVNNVFNSSTERAKVVIISNNQTEKSRASYAQKNKSNASDNELLKRLADKQTVYKSKRTPVRVRPQLAAVTKNTTKNKNLDNSNPDSPRTKFFEKLNSTNPQKEKYNVFKVNQITTVPSSVSAKNQTKKANYLSSQFVTSANNDLTIEDDSPINYLESVNEKQKDFECDCLEFLISLNLTLNQINMLKVSDVRRQFERQLSRAFTSGERLILKEIALDFCKKRSESLERDAMNNAAKKLKGMIVDVDDNEINNSNDEPSTSRGFRPVEIDPKIQKQLLTNFNAKQNERQQLINESKESPAENSILNSSNSKFTFKRINSRHSSEEDTEFSSAHQQSSKKAKFRQENPTSPLPSAGVNRNRLALSDRCQLQSPNRTHKVAKRILTTKKSTGSSNPVKKPFSFRNLNIDLDDDILAINEVHGNTKGKNVSNKINVLTEELEEIEQYFPSSNNIVCIDDVNTNVKATEEINCGFTLGEKPKNKFGLPT